MAWAPCVEGGADVIDGGLAVFHVERCGFEEDIGLGGLRARSRTLVTASAIGLRELLSGRGRPLHIIWNVQAIGVGDPSQAAAGDSGDAEGDSVVVAELLFAIEQELHESAVDVAEAEEAEIVGVDASPRVGKSPDSFLAANAALRRRSSMVFRASVVQDFMLFCERS